MLSKAYGGTNMVSQTILRFPAVISRTGLSRSTIYLHISKGTFPKSIKRGERASGFLESDINEWIESRVHASNNEDHGVGQRQTGA